MSIKDIINNDYFKLFVKREGKVVLGKHYANLWLLCCVLIVTFLAIAFSNASLNYLDFKMNDPFINWVDIKNNHDGDFVGFENDLKREDVRQSYHFEGHKTDKNAFIAFATKGEGSKPLDCRFFAEIQTPLVQAILDEENVVAGCRIELDKLCNESFGVIITQEALVNKLGYKGEIPPYINFLEVCDMEAQYEFYTDVIMGGYAKVPLPVLAVVHRLPTNMDIVGTKHFYNQMTALAFNLYNPSYHNSFVYWLPESVDATKLVTFFEEVHSKVCSLSYYPTIGREIPKMENHLGGSFVSFRFDYEEDVDFYNNKLINDAVMAEFGKKGVERIYIYEEGVPVEDYDDYISVYFQDLNEIGSFQKYAKDNFNIKIDMSQISAKENFNEVSIMANILSWTMIVFAIVCIILFIVNLLQSYFQKVKRNLGTFKAFGIGNRELISVYVLIMVATVCAAIVISFAVSFAIQILLPLLGILKDGTFNYLDLWSGKMVGSVAIIVVASITTVYIVMYRLLKATPGDLIYDR